MRQLIALNQIGIGATVDASTNGNCSVLSTEDVSQSSMNQSDSEVDSDSDFGGFESNDEKQLSLRERSYSTFHNDDKNSLSNNPLNDSLHFKDFEVESNVQGQAIEQIEALYVNNCLAYVAGYVVYTLKNRKICLLCRPALHDNEKDKLNVEYLKLIQRKERAELKIPSKTIFTLVQAAEKMFEADVANQANLPQHSNLDSLLTYKNLTTISLTELFPTLVSHLEQQESDHTTLAQIIIKRYLQVRCRSYIKPYNNSQSANPVSERNQFKKLLQNLGV